jgi:hypothetical protein
MTDVNSYNELFKYKDNPVNKPISLAGSVISAYDNNINSNINDLVDILNNKDNTVLNNNKLKKKLSLDPISENNINNSNVTPDDSVSNIGKIDSLLKENNIPNNEINNNDLDNNISVIKSVIKPEYTPVNNSVNNSNVMSKSIFEYNDTNNTNTINTNSNINDDIKNTKIGGDNYNTNNNLILAIIVIFMFCCIGFSSFCNVFNNKIIFILIIVMSIGFFYFKQ